MSDLVSRAWNGTPIARRTADGYVNATAMCKANSKRWSDFRESDRCQRYLDALAETTGIPVFDLVESSRGQGGGTFVHPDLATELARWIDDRFAVFINVWFREEFEKRVSQVRDTQPLKLNAAEAVGATAKVICDIHQMIMAHTPGLVDARMEVELKRDLLLLKSVAVQATTGMLPGTSEVLSAADKLPRFMGVVVYPELAIGVTEFFVQLNDSNLSKIITNHENELGKRTKAAYRLRYDKEPEPSNGHYLGEKRLKRGFPILFPTKTGKNVPIATYEPIDWDLIVYAAREMGLLRPEQAAKLLAECQQFRQGMEG